MKVSCRLASIASLVSLCIAGSANATEPRVSLVRVDKSERRLELLAGDKVVKSYAIALGANPVGHKRQEGDERTPEGRYMLDWRNPGSSFYRSLHVFYPDKADKEQARQRGVGPGGDIMIHGQPNGYGWWSWLLQLVDWTNGCIAVDNEAMAEVWRMVPDGTPIEIHP